MLSVAYHYLFTYRAPEYLSLINCAGHLIHHWPCPTRQCSIQFLAKLLQESVQFDFRQRSQGAYLVLLITLNRTGIALLESQFRLE